jgi:two-component sensor histidine kinase
MKNPDHKILPGAVEDMNGDGSGDLIFAITGGFSRHPRNVFIFDVLHNSLIKSPESGAYIKELFLFDLDKDGYDEILLETFAAENYNYDFFPYSDTSSWMMVLDNNLDFLFPPIEFTGSIGVCDSKPFKSKKGQILLMGNFHHASASKIPGKLFLTDLHGTLLKEKELDQNGIVFKMDLLSINDTNLNTKAIGVVEQEGLFEIDENLNLKNISHRKYPLKIIESIDFDSDGKDEFIILAPDLKKYLILCNDFSHPVELDFPIQSTNPLFSIKLNGDKPPQLSVQGDQDWKLFDYGINPFWRFRFLIWLGIYLSVLSFILVIRKLYSFQLKKRYETEKKITTLQLSSVKAQMEPHFIMNTINTIGSSIYRQKPDEAYQLLLNFSGMVRSLLLSSDKLTSSLKEELDFVKNYLDLEKSRFSEVFDYKINEPESIDKEIIIPKMIIQLHVENALKHGLLPKKSGGILTVDIAKAKEYLQITITDNGIGRNLASKNISQSTGKGMKILAQMFDTYNKYNRMPLRQEIIDLYEDGGSPAGTKVQIFVPLDFNPEIY